MKKLKIIVGVLIIAGVLGGVYGWFFVYNKPHRNYEEAKPEFTLTAEQCYFDFAQKKNDYTGKVIRIEGIARKIEETDSLVTVVYVFEEGLFGDQGIRCVMLNNYKTQAKNINLGEPHAIKGYCTGFNETDVILENCSLIN